ncbi:hypothetical protein CCR75_005677 [Bremia lactucae]|uniref:Uncharacterized protein n=1 Tax=Bremia lactucae TaxID=4779 RepID=A0A976IE39_BRELC|nr:hypothetical protein CCR75_005677 [Bremia lactucae]
MIVYADDADFVCQSAEIASVIETEAPAALAKWSLQMNTSMTDHTIPNPQSNRITRAKDRGWRITRKLASLLGDVEDVSGRKNLATAALHRISVLRSLENFLRRQLRKDIGVHYPDTISNDKIYNRTKAEPLRFLLASQPMEPF